jgi:hypothetical protein
MGRVKDDNGVFEELRAEENKIAFKNEKGEILGYLTGMDISLDSDEEKINSGMELK